MTSLSRNKNARIRNLATIFIQDYCTEGQAGEIKDSQPSTSKNLSNISTPI